MSATHLLLRWVEALEDRLSGAGLGLVVVDRVGPLAQCTPDDTLHKGYTVRATSTRNQNLSRNQEHAYTEETFVVEVMYELIILGQTQKARRAEAMLLEEQVRAVLTGMDEVPRLRFVSATRGLHPRDASYWTFSITFTADRSARLGG